MPSPLPHKGSAEAETDRSVTVADHRSVITSVRRRCLEDFQVQLRYRPRSLSAGILLFVIYIYIYLFIFIFMSGAS